MELLVDRGADMAAAEIDGWTALHVAALYGKLEVVELLVEKGAVVSAVSHLGMTPLCFASFNGEVAALQALMRAGGDAAQGNCIGHSAVHAAALYDQVDVLRALLPPPTSSGSGSSGHHGVSTTESDGADDAAHGSLSATMTCRFGNTPLHLAAGSGRMRAARFLLDRGERLIDAHNVHGQTPLHLACESGHCDMVQLLIERGADMHKVDGCGATALHVAAINRQPEAALVLLKKKARITARDDEGNTPLYYAVYAPCGEPQDVIPDAASERFRREVMNVAELLIDKGASVNFRSVLWLSRRASPLSVARARWGYGTAWKLLQLRMRFLWKSLCGTREADSSAEPVPLAQVAVVGEELSVAQAGSPAVGTAAAAPAE